MDKDLLFGKLDTNDPGEISAMEKALEEKYQLSQSEKKTTKEEAV